MLAQRRPGREPRRHNPDRRKTAAAVAALNEGRGVNPGDTYTVSVNTPPRGSLNEGRGVNPGDTSNKPLSP